MRLEIRPEPDEHEREAILAALAEEESERRDDSPWARGTRPPRGDEEPAEP